MFLFNCSFACTNVISQRTKILVIKLQVFPYVDRYVNLISKGYFNTCQTSLCSVLWFWNFFRDQKSTVILCFVVEHIRKYIIPLIVYTVYVRVLINKPIDQLIGQNIDQ